jgi:hypothetical protein
LPTVSRPQRKKRLRNERTSQITKKKLTSVYLAQSMAITSITFLLAKKKAIEKNQDWQRKRVQKTRNTFVLRNCKKSEKSCKNCYFRLTANNVDRRSLKQKKGAQKRS